MNRIVTVLSILSIALEHRHRERQRGRSAGKTHIIR